MIKTENIIKIVNSPDVSIAPMTMGRVTGTDCDILILDEGGWIRKDLLAYQMYLTCRPMVSTSKFKHIINASTPARDTAFQDEYVAISELEKKYNTKLTSLHDCEDCSWISPEWISSERAKYPLWYIELNYYCKWTVPYGAVFEKIYEVHSQETFTPEFLYHIKPKFVGVDFNAGDRDHPHYLVTLDYDANFCYVLDEYQFIDLHFLFEERWRNLSLELEDGLYNTQYTEQTKSMGLICIYFAWSAGEKMNRVQELRNRALIIDKTRAPLTYQNLLNAAYNQKSRLPELEKRTDQHGLDCLLHGVHPLGGKIYLSEKTDMPKGKVFAKERILKV